MRTSQAPPFQHPRSTPDVHVLYILWELNLAHIRAAMASLLLGWKNSEDFFAPTAFRLYSPTLNTVCGCVGKSV